MDGLWDHIGLLSENQWGDYEWNVQRGLCGSGHFQVILTSDANEENFRPNTWNFCRVDRQTFRGLCQSQIRNETVICLLKILQLNLLTSWHSYGIHTKNMRCYNKHRKVPWFNNNCQKAIKEWRAKTFNEKSFEIIGFQPRQPWRSHQGETHLVITQYMLKTKQIPMLIVGSHGRRSLHISKSCTALQLFERTNGRQKDEMNQA